MGTTDVLRSSIEDTHTRVVERFDAARDRDAPADRAHGGHERIDTFLATACRHLHAVDAVLLPAVRGAVPDGTALVHRYVASVKRLEVVLAHVKAHEYGSVYERGFAWPAVWAEAEEALGAQWREETGLGERLTEALPDEELGRLADGLRAAEDRAPSRPHPYSPHTGPLGTLARTVMHTADRFWDTVEGRMVPEPRPAPKPPPGRFAQYFLADPRFEEEGSAEEESAEERPPVRGPGTP